MNTKLVFLCCFVIFGLLTNCGEAIQTTYDSGVPSGCYPVCRAGFVCVNSECVTGCNPPCAVDEFCNDNFECTVTPPERTYDAGNLSDAGNQPDTADTGTPDTGTPDTGADSMLFETGLSTTSLVVPCVRNVDCPTGSVCLNTGVCDFANRNFVPNNYATFCSGHWVNTNIDPLNCGSCGNVCSRSGNGSCQGGICQPCESSYGFNWVSCGSTCVDLSYDRNNCNGCGGVCGSSQTCFEGTCE
jgi:hypothetical protein